MTDEERIAAIQKFGYTERKAAFLCLAALHGGYFLRRQYNTFHQQRPSGTADRLIEKAVMQGHVRIHESADRTFIYHIRAKSLFEAMGEEDNRNRRWRRPYSVKVKLMGLDFVLAHPEHRYLATETEKFEFFVGALGLKREWLPLRIYRSRNGRTQTTRYFVDKFPLFLPGASSAPAPVVTFCYVDGNLGKPAGFDPTCSNTESFSGGWSPFRWCMCRQTKGRSLRQNASFGASAGRWQQNLRGCRRIQIWVAY
jgi:hypothetical protein